MPPMARGAVPAQKAKNMRGAFIKLLKFCKRFLPAIITALVLAVASTSFSIIGPEKVGDIGNEIQAGITGEMNYRKIVDIALFLVII